MTKIVLVCTSAPELKVGHPTGLWLEEAATPYYMFLEKGFEVVIASPKGGPVPIDSSSMKGDFFTDATKKFMHDPEAIDQLCHSVTLESIDFSAVDAIYLTGGHGPCVEFVDQPVLKKAIETMYAANKVVAADCHGPVGLVDCCKPDGTPLVAGKAVT